MAALKRLAESTTHLERVDGVMLGRAAYKNPYLLAGVDGALFGDTTPPPSREEIVDN